MKLQKNRYASHIITPPPPIRLGNIKFPILAILLALTVVLTFTACSSEEEEYDAIPSELQNTSWTISSSTYSFSAASWSCTNADNNFTVSDLTVTSITNTNAEYKTNYPSGYEIRGKVISSGGSYKSSHPVGKIVIYQFFHHSTDKTLLLIMGPLTNN